MNGSATSIPSAMRSLIICFLAVFFLGSRSDAQIIAVHFVNEKMAKKYKKHLVEFKGEMVVLGEPKSGFKYIEDTGTLTYNGQDSNQLFVIDPNKPGEFAYYIVDGKKKETTKKNRLLIQGRYVDRLSMVMRDQSLPGLTREYLLRSDQLRDFRAARDAEKKGSVAWLATHNRLLNSLERLRGWLAAVGYEGALKNLDKELKKEKRVVTEEALRARYLRAVSSVETCEVPEQFATLSQKISGGKDVFHGYRSQHLLLYYLTEGGGKEQIHISDSQAEGLLVMGEKIIEGFRSEFVDPYLDENYPDQVPDDLFVTFAFFPNDPDVFQSYAGPLYGRGQSPSNREIRGGGQDGGTPVHRRNYWRLDDTDPEGIICHGIGHELAARHFALGRVRMNQDWLTEAVANQLSYEHLGRNEVTCFGLRVKPAYNKRVASKPGQKTIAGGRRSVYNQLALDQGSNIQEIALKKLYQLADADLAKGWSFYDYIARKEGKAGQLWLRAAGEFSSERSTFIEKWREAAAKVLGVDSGQAFKTLEDRWRAYAESEQLNAGNK